MIRKILEKSKVQQQLIGITLYGEAGFWCGIVEDYNNEFVQLKHFTKYGELDGVAIEKIAQIERIDIEDDYLKSMKVIIARKSELQTKPLKSRIFEELDENNWQFVCLKPYENEKNILVSIQINSDSFYQGYVIEINTEFLKYEIIGDSGQNEGLSLFKLDDVTSVKINDLECRRKFILNDERKKVT